MDDGQAWNDPSVRVVKQSLRFVEDDINRFIDEITNRRSHGRPPTSVVPDSFYEQALRVLGHYIDEQKPRDIMFFEQDRSFVLRLMMSTRTGPRHVLVEFTREELESIIGHASQLRGRPSSESILDVAR
jgi:hypothetical protein